MKICIDGFRNIEHLEYEIMDKKHNFLFGLSGSGKSSISGSIQSKEHFDYDKTFGKTIEQSILIDGKDRSEFRIDSFNGATKNYYFSENRNDILRLFLLDESINLEKYQKSFTSLIQSFIDKTGVYSSTYNELTKLLKETKAEKLNKNGTLKTNAITNRVINELKKSGDGASMRKLLKLDPSFYLWFKSGINFFDASGDNRCPFCGKKIFGKGMIDKINSFKSFDPKVIGDYKETQHSLEAIFAHHIKEEISAVEKVSKMLVSINNAVNQFDRFVSFLQKLFNIELFDNEISKFEIEKIQDVERFFKGLNKIVKSVNSQIDRINRQYDSAKKKTDEALKKKADVINHHLSILDIPYVLKVKYVSRDYNEYYFIHKSNPESRKDSPSQDNYLCMSEGEKVIVTLLLFIEQCKKEKPDLIIFDDPVSSYDEFRRSKLLKIIQKRLSGQTVLILSHDQVFAKCALFQQNNCRGRVSYLNHFVSPIIVEDVSASDFVSYRDFVLQSLESCDSYLLKVAYLRSLFEAKHGTNVYRYLSAILHSSSKKSIDSLLSTLSEKDILEDIKQETGIVLSPYQDSYLSNIDFDKMSFYEKCLVARVFGDKGQPLNEALKDVFDELSDFLHANQVLAIGLNPSKYYLCSRRLYNTINANACGTKSLFVKNVTAKAA